MNRCPKCHSIPCGCSDTPLVTSSSITCPVPLQCSEYTYTGCILYNGPEVSELCIKPGMTLNEVIQALILLNTNAACVTDLCPDHAPYVTVTKLTTTSIALSWGESPNALSYTIRYMAQDASPAVWTDVTISPSTLNYTITGLECGTEYLVIVSMQYGAGPDSCESLEMHITTSDC